MNKPKIVFICIYNSCRSQTAKAIGKKYFENIFKSYSAGTELSREIDQRY